MRDDFLYLKFIYAVSYIWSSKSVLLTFFYYTLPTAEVQRTRKEMEIEIEKLERQKENLAQKLAQTEKDLQLALKQEQQAHEEDIDRLTKEKVTFLWW